jgi:hypothetical protein
MLNTKTAGLVLAGAVAAGTVPVVALAAPRPAPPVRLAQGAAASPALPSAAHAESAHAALPLCRSAQLVLRRVAVEGAAGTRYETWRMRNVGGTCRTQGWIGALNFGPDGRPLPTTVRRVAGPAPRVVLRHGQHASFVISHPQPGVLGCRGQNAPAMLVTPPDNTSPNLVRPGQNACRGVVDVRPIRFGG